MEARYIAVLAGGLLLAAGLFLFVDAYLAGIVLIIDVALAMAFQIMSETHRLPPRLTCWLSEDARKIIVRNQGNETATAIRITLVPLGMEFDLPELRADARHEFSLPSMINEAKAVVDYEDASGRKFSGSFPLSATGKSDDDLLKPTFPIFGWK